MKSLLPSLFVTLGLACAASAQAAPVTLITNDSTGNLTLYGQGAISPGVGSYTVGQGAASYNSITNVSTFTFTGTIAGGPAPFSSGTFGFVTTYSGPDTPDGGPNAPKAQANPSDTEEFFYDSFDPAPRCR